MHTQQSSLHYAPVSVGGLMDPDFLREAVQDAEGRHRSVSSAGRWRAAVLATTRAWLSHRPSTTTPTGGA